MLNLFALRNEVGVLWYDLGHLVVHIVFLSLINLSEGVRNDGNQEVKHHDHVENSAEEKQNPNSEFLFFSEIRIVIA